MGLEGLGTFTRRHRLTPVGARRWQGVARTGALPVSITVGLERRGELYASVIVRPATPPIAVTACPREHWLGTDAPVLTGDPVFDASVALRLTDPHALCLFSATVRDALRLALVSGDVVVENGELHGTFAVDRYTDDALDQALERLIALAHALSVPVTSWLENLLELAFDDDPRVSAQTQIYMDAHPKLKTELELHRLKRAPPTEHPLDTLIERIANRATEAPSRAGAFLQLLTHVSATELVRYAKAAPDLWPALARFGDGEAFDTLMLELERRLGPEHLSNERDAVLELLQTLWPHVHRSRVQTALAFSRIIRALAHPGALDITAQLLDTKDQTRFFAALTALTTLTVAAAELARRLGENGLTKLSLWLTTFLADRPPHAADLPLLTCAIEHLLPQTEHAAQTIALLECLVDRCGVDAEPVLLTALTGHDTVIHRALEHLGDVGGRRAQAHLEPLTGGLFRSSEVKRRARASLDRIRQRLGPLDHGALSLVEDQAGGLTTSDP